MLVEMKFVFTHLAFFLENDYLLHTRGVLVRFIMLLRYKTFVDERQKKRGERGWDALLDKWWQRCRWKGLAYPP